MIDRTVLDIYSFMYSWMLPKTVTESAPVRFFYHFEIFRCHWRFDLKCQGVRQLDLCHFRGLSYKQPHSLLSTECWSQVMDELTHNISKVIFWSDSEWRYIILRMEPSDAVALPDQWRFCSGRINLVDDSSLGFNPRNILKQRTWVPLGGRGMLAKCKM